MSILGQLSTPDRVKTTTEFVLGARSNVLFTGTHDTGPADRQFFQLGYNADYNLVSGNWKFQRFLSSTAASAIRLGPATIEFLTTSQTTGDLNAQMATVLKFKATPTNPNTDYIYIPVSWSRQTYDGEARDIGDYRLDFKFLPTPATIYGGGSATQATAHKEASDFGVSTHAKAIAISVEATAGTSAARVKVYQRRTSPSSKYGFVTAAPANGRGAGWGFVPLGTGSYDGEFTIERTAAFTSLTMYIVGYLV